jgi:hypothetical protein
MALVVEDGSNVADADSYISLADAEAYYLTYQGVAWDATISDDLKEAAIRRAARYLDAIWWKGERTNKREQAMAWPRYGATDCDGTLIASGVVPVEVVNANALLAFYEADNPNALDPTVTLNAIARREKVDVIEVEYRDGPVTAESARPVVTAAQDQIRCLILGGRPGFLRRA